MRLKRLHHSCVVTKIFNSNKVVTGDLSDNKVTTK